MAQGGGDIIARIGLDASKYEAGAEAVIRAAQRIEKAEQQLARAIDDLNRRTAQRRADYADMSEKQQERNAEKFRRRQEADELRVQRLREDVAKRREATINALMRQEDQASQKAADNAVKSAERRMKADDAAADAAFRRQMKQAAGVANLEQKLDKQAEANRRRAEADAAADLKKAERKQKQDAAAEEAEFRRQMRQAAQVANLEKMLERQSEQNQRRAQKDADANKKAADKKAEDDRRAAERRANVAKRLADQKVKENERTARAAQREAEREEAAFQSAAMSVGRFFLRFASTAGVIAGLREMASVVTEMRKDFEDAANANMKLRADLRGMASVRQGGPTMVNGQDIQAALSFRAATGIGTTEDSAEFMRSFLSSVDIGQRMGNIDQATSDALMLGGGQMQARVGGDVSQFAELMALMPMFGKVDSAEQAMGQAEQIRRLLVVGRGDMDLIKPLIEFASTAVNDKDNQLKSLPQAASLVSFASLATGAGQAGTRAEQLRRALLAGFYRKGRGPTGAMMLPNGERMTMSKFYEMAGSVEGDDPLTRLQKAFTFVEQNKPADVPVAGYLTKMGWGNEEERVAFEQMYRFRAQLPDVIAAGNMPWGAAAAAAKTDNAAFMRQPTTRRNAAAALGELQQAGFGENQDLQVMMDSMAAANPDQQRNFFQRWVTDNVFGARTLFTDSGANVRRREQSLTRLRQLASRYNLLDQADAQLGEGYGARARGLGMGMGWLTGTGAAPEQEAKVLTDLLKKAGVDPVAGLQREAMIEGSNMLNGEVKVQGTDRQIQLLQTIADALKPQGGVAPPPPAAGVPARPVVAPPLGGVRR